MKKPLCKSKFLKVYVQYVLECHCDHRSYKGESVVRAILPSHIEGNDWAWQAIFLEQHSSYHSKYMTIKILRVFALK